MQVACKAWPCRGNLLDFKFVDGGEDFDPDLTTGELDLFALSVHEDGPARLGGFFPGAIEGFAVDKECGLAVANNVVEQMFVIIEGTLLFGELDDDIFGGKLFFIFQINLGRTANRSFVKS